VDQLRLRVDDADLLIQYDGGDNNAEWQGTHLSYLAILRGKRKGQGMVGTAGYRDILLEGALSQPAFRMCVLTVDRWTKLATTCHSHHVCQIGDALMHTMDKRRDGSNNIWRYDGMKKEAWVAGVK